MTRLIRPATAADIDDAAGLHQSTALAAYAHIFPEMAPKPALDDMAATWHGIVTRGRGWLAVDENRLVGVAGVTPEVEGSRLGSVYVDPDRWGRGIGSDLVDVAESEAVRRGWLPLKLWVLEANKSTRGWYERRGWVRDESQRRTVWGEIDDVGYVLGEEGVARWRV